MNISTAQSIKLALMSATGLTRDALHIYVGMAVYLTLIVLMRRAKPCVALLAVVIVACAGEWVDSQDDLVSFGHWRWQASVHDVINTAFWPAVITLVWWVKRRNGGWLGEKRFD